MEDKSLYMWGWNTSGQLGDGTEENKRKPVKVLENVQSVSLGCSHSGAVTEDGSLYMWGADDAIGCIRVIIINQKESNPLLLKKTPSKSPTIPNPSKKERSLTVRLFP